MNVTRLRSVLPMFLFVVACLVATVGTSRAQAGCGSYLVMRRSSLSSQLGDLQAGVSVSQPVRLNSTLPFRPTTCVGAHCSQAPWETPPCHGPHCQSRSKTPYAPPAGVLVVVVGEELIGIPSIAAIKGSDSQRTSHDRGLRVPSVTLSGLLRPPRV